MGCIQFRSRNPRCAKKDTADAVLQGYAARGDSIVIVRCVQSWLSAPRDADTASGGMRTLRVQIPKVAKTKKHRLCGVFVFGAPSGIRTRDPLIKSQLLYQLS